MALQQLISDEELVKGYINGNEAYLEQLLAKYKSKIFSSIYYLCKDRCLAEDIFQDTFMKVIKTLKSGNYNEEGKFLPWVMRIGHNLVIDHFRKAKRTPTITTSEGFDIFDVIGMQDEGIESKMLKKQSKTDLRALVRELPQEQKEVVVLRHFANLSFKEIADITNVSINTALGRMRYALNNLRKMIDERKLVMHV
ncbi:MAG: sigma-70 family RNA polymerase sigma factor [Bacteroidia bacterium]|nr:sigma-70 family RNA polymerase sigma factor [Bacteroidia bacterium]